MSIALGTTHQISMGLIGAHLSLTEIDRVWSILAVFGGARWSSGEIGRAMQNLLEPSDA